MPNDRIKLEILINGTVQKKYTAEYDVSEDGVHLPLLEKPVQIAEIMPKEAAYEIAKALVDNEIYVESEVRLTVTHRGALED